MSVTLLLALAAVTGCPEFQTGMLIESQESVVAHARAARPTQTPAMRMTQDGARVGVVAALSCEAYDMQTVEHVHVFERRDPMHATAQTMLWGGLVVGALGGVLVATAGGDASSSTATSSSSSSLSPSEQRASGGVMIGVGVVAAIIGGARLLQGRGREERTSSTQVAGPVTAPSIQCPRPAPFPGEWVHLEGPLGVLDLGQTDARGVLSVDLRRIVPRRWVVGEGAPAEVALLSSTHPVGRVSLAAVRDHYDDQVWNQLNPETCRVPSSVGDCRPMLDYQRAFPAGRHVDEANAAISAGRQRLAALEAQARREREAAEAARIERERAIEQARLEHERAAEEERQRRVHEWETQQARYAAEQRAQAQRARQQEQARQRAADCRARCRSGCQGNSGCVAQCVAQSCSAEH